VVETGETLTIPQTRAVCCGGLAALSSVGHQSLEKSAPSQIDGRIRHD